VVGDFDRRRWRNARRAAVRRLEEPSPTSASRPRHFAVDPMDRMIETPDKANAVFRGRDQPESCATTTRTIPGARPRNYSSAGRRNARLAGRVREKDGLSYSVGSWINASDGRGPASRVYAIYAPQNRARSSRRSARSSSARSPTGSRPPSSSRPQGAARARRSRATTTRASRAAALLRRRGTHLQVGRRARRRIRGPRGRTRSATPAPHLRPTSVDLKAGDFPKVAGKGK